MSKTFFDQLRLAKKNVAIIAGTTGLFAYYFTHNYLHYYVFGHDGKLMLIR